MADTTVPVQGGLGVNITIPAAARIATFSGQQYQVVQIVGFPNEPNQPLVLFSGTGYYTSSVFANGATVQVLAGAAVAQYNVGVSAVVGVAVAIPTQGTPGTLNATGALTTPLLLTRIVTSSTAAAVAGTLDTGTVTDAALSMAIGDNFNWALVNTGPNTFTVTAATGHTIVGTATVLTTISGQFRTVKTAAATFVTYRIG